MDNNKKGKVIDFKARRDEILRKRGREQHTEKKILHIARIIKDYKKRDDCIECVVLDLEGLILHYIEDISA